MEQRRTAIISGGFGGVGLATGKKLAESGFDVVALYHRTPQDTADDLVRAFPGGNHEAVACDIDNPSAVHAVFAAVAQKRGDIHACIHAAVSPILRKNLLETRVEELKQQFATGAFGGFNVVAAAANAMKDRGGVIVGVLSQTIYGSLPHPRMAAYAVAKHALRGLLKELHLEVGSRIAVNAIAPDFMDTPLNRDLPPAVREFILERATSGSIRSPEEAARAIAFLCSPEGANTKGKIVSLSPDEIEEL